MKFGTKTTETLASVKEAASSGVTWLVVAILGAGAMIMFGLMILAGAINGN